MSDLEERKAERTAANGSYEEEQRARLLFCRRNGHDVGVATASRVSDGELRKATARFCWRCSSALGAFTYGITTDGSTGHWPPEMITPGIL